MKTILKLLIIIASVYYTFLCSPLYSLSGNTYSASTGLSTSGINKESYSLLSIDIFDTLIFDLSKTRVTGGILQIPVFVNSNDTILSFDFAFRYTKGKINYTDFIKHNSLLSANVYYNSNDSTLRGTVNSLQEISSNLKLLTLRFNILSGTIDVNDLYNFKGWLNGIRCVVKIRGNICQNDSLTLDIKEPNAVEWLWSTGAVTETITVGSAGNYFCEIIKSDGTSSTSQIFSFKSRYNPSISVFPSGTTSICDGDSLMLSANTSTTNSIEWSNGAKTFSIYAKTQGIYSATTIDTFGCSALSNPAEVLFLPSPDATINSSGPFTFCNGDSVVLSVLEVSGNEYLWSHGSTNSYITVKNSGDFSVRVTNSSGCSRISDTISANVNPLPNSQITFEGSSNICPGNFKILNATPGSGYNYLWSTGATTPSIIVDYSGTFSVEITSDYGCSSESQPININVGYLPGDFNLDGSVDGLDFSRLIGLYGLICMGCPEDIDKDGRVDALDFSILIGQYGLSCN